MRQLAGASVLGLAGYGRESMERMVAVNKDMADFIGKWNDTLAKTVTGENDAVHLGRTESRAERQLAETGRHHRATESAAKGAAGSGGLSREERMRYTTLLSEASRRMTEDQKALAALQKDPMYSMAKPGSPQQIELQGLRDSIAALTEERKTYQGMLVGSQVQNSPPAATVEPGQPLRKLAGADEYAKLPSGTRFIDPNGKVRVKPQEASSKSAPAPKAAASPAAAPMPQEVSPSTKQALDDFNRGFQRSPAEVVAANMERDRQQAEVRRLADEEVERKKAAQQKQIAESFATAQDAMRRRISGN
jgi:hypothetical protein